jgi:hypothetical protein
MSAKMVEILADAVEFSYHRAVLPYVVVSTNTDTGIPATFPATTSTAGLL